MRIDSNKRGLGQNGITALKNKGGILYFEVFNQLQELVEKIKPKKK